MKTLFTLLLLPLPFLYAIGQEITKDFVDALWEKAPYKGKALQNVQLLNMWLEVIGDIDTVSYVPSGDTLVYTFKNEVINADVSGGRGEQPRITWLTGIHGYQLLGCRYTSPSGEGVGMKEEAIVVRRTACDAMTSNETLTIEHYNDGVLSDRYVTVSRRSLKVLVEGQYSQIDSIWLDTVLHINPVTYDRVDSLVIRSKFPVKAGQWLYYNEQGDTIKIEEYPEID